MNQVINKMEDNKNFFGSFMKDALDDLPSGIRQTDYINFRELFLFQMMSDTVKDNDLKFCLKILVNFLFYV